MVYGTLSDEEQHAPKARKGENSKEASLTKWKTLRGAWRKLSLDLPVFLGLCPRTLCSPSEPWESLKSSKQKVMQASLLLKRLQQLSGGRRLEITRTRLWEDIHQKGAVIVQAKDSESGVKDGDGGTSERADGRETYPQVKINRIQ